MVKILKLLAPGLAASVMGLFSLQTQAAVVLPPPVFSTFNFSGNCEDCAIAGELSSYAVTARLVLQNYFQGNTISAANFVSFVYGGSNLLPAYSISSADLTFLRGFIPVALPNAALFDVGGTSRFFYGQDTGRWETGRIPASFTYTGSVITMVNFNFIGGNLSNVGERRHGRLWHLQPTRSKQRARACNPAAIGCGTGSGWGGAPATLTLSRSPSLRKL